MKIDGSSVMYKTCGGGDCKLFVTSSLNRYQLIVGTIGIHVGIDKA